MGRIARSCLQSLLKLVNSAIGMVGIAMILYSLWMFRIWYKQIDGDHFPIPWFIYAFLGLGITLCVITCSGHVAAETVNGHCLSCYMVFVFLLFLLEAAVTADVLLNRHWEDDFPEDPTGRFDEFKNFVKSNFEICKWIGSLIVAAQGLSIFLAIILRALGPDRGSYYDSDDEYAPARLPLLKNHVQQTPYVADPLFPLKNDSWNVALAHLMHDQLQESGWPANPVGCMCMLNADGTVLFFFPSAGSPPDDWTGLILWPMHDQLLESGWPTKPVGHMCMVSCPPFSHVQVTRA